MQLRLLKEKLKIDIAIKLNQKLFQILSLLVLLLFSTGCKKTSLNNNPKLSKDSHQKEGCLDNLNMQELTSSLEECNRELRKHPNSLESLIDRSLIYSIIGKHKLACNDVMQGIKILQSTKKYQDSFIVDQFNIRYESCIQLVNIDVND